MSSTRVRMPGERLERCSSTGQLGGVTARILLGTPWRRDSGSSSRHLRCVPVCDVNHGPQLGVVFELRTRIVTPSRIAAMTVN
jgi:hypothetical protein